MKSNRKYISIVLLVAVMSVLVLGVFIGTKLSSEKYKQSIAEFKNSSSIYRWYAVKRILSETVSAKTEPVDCPVNFKAIGLFGQSNSANRIKRSGGPKSINDGKTFMWDWVTQRCYPYAEPLLGTDLGADSEGLGNIITRTILDLRRTDKQTNVIIVAFGRGGSSVFSWSHGIESIRFDEVIKRLRTARIDPVLFLWHQGESDAIEEIYFPEKVSAYGMGIGPKRKYYASALDVVMQKLHASFPSALVGIALATVCDNYGSQEVREAQKAIISKYPWIQLSSDTDVLGHEYRADDRCHINELGEKHVAEDYLRLAFLAFYQ
jgi:hypothetical protein